LLAVVGDEAQVELGAEALLGAPQLLLGVRLGAFGDALAAQVAGLDQRHLVVRRDRGPVQVLLGPLDLFAHLRRRALGRRGGGFHGWRGWRGGRRRLLRAAGGDQRERQRQGQALGG